MPAKAAGDGAGVRTGPPGKDDSKEYGYWRWAKGGIDLKGKFCLLLLLMLLIPQAIIFALARDTALATDKWFGQMQAAALVCALLLALVTPGLILEWLIGRRLEKIRRFCDRVKQGDYQTRLLLANESCDKNDEDAVTLLMRDMNWMARQIELREQELKQAVEKMQRMALTDPLTTIANRRCFFDTLERQFAALVCSCRPISLLIIDVDRFKKVNDTYGHEAGDRVLLELAGIIQQYSRETDLAARIGGEEFSVLLPDTNSQEAVLVARRIKTAIASCRFVVQGNRQISVTISIGVCTLAHTPCFDRDKLYTYADQALYYSKNNGRNSISVFDPGIRSAVKVS